MKKLLVAMAAALCMALPASAQMLIGTDAGGQKVVLTSEACTNDKVVQAAMMYSMFAGAPMVEMSGEVTLKSGEILQFCYVRMDNKSVFVVDEGGGYGRLDLSGFKESI